MTWNGLPQAHKQLKNKFLLTILKNTINLEGWNLTLVVLRKRFTTLIYFQWDIKTYTWPFLFNLYSEQTCHNDLSLYCQFWAYFLPAGYHIQLQFSCHTETSQLRRSVYQCTGFYMMGRFTRHEKQHKNLTVNYNRAKKGFLNGILYGIITTFRWLWHCIFTEYNESISWENITFT